MNIIQITGFVTKVKYDSRKGGNPSEKGIFMAFTISTKTGNNRRLKAGGAEGRDYFDVEIFIPTSRERFADYIKQGTHLHIGGIPTFNIHEEKRYFTIVADINHVGFVERNNTNEKPSDQENNSRNTNYHQSNSSQDEESDQGRF